MPGSNPSPGGGPVLSVVIPTRNEAANAPALVAQLAAVLGPISSEVIFVDDSDDGTPGTLEAAAADSGLQLTVVHREGAERKGGLSTAVLAGIREATGLYVLIMDADLQHPTDLIAALLQRARDTDADIVIASRFVPGGSDKGLAGRQRRVISWGAKTLVKLLFLRTLQGVTDPLSGFFVARRDPLITATLRPIGFKILLDILIRCDHSIVEELPLVFAARAGGDSKATLSQGRDFLTHVFTLFRDVRFDGELRRLRSLGNRRRT